MNQGSQLTFQGKGHKVGMQYSKTQRIFLIPSLGIYQKTSFITHNLNQTPLPTRQTHRPFLYTELRPNKE